MQSISGKSERMIRRSFLKRLAVLPLAAAAAPSNAGAAGAKLKIMIKSAWGSDDPTKAAFPFLHGDALAEAGHEVQIFLLGEAVSLMRNPVANAVVPVGWPPPWPKLYEPPSRSTRRSTCEAHAQGLVESLMRTWSVRRLPSPIPRSSCSSLRGPISCSLSDRGRDEEDFRCVAASRHCITSSHRLRTMKSGRLRCNSFES